jgi:hypothetical protein
MAPMPTGVTIDATAQQLEDVQCVVAGDITQATITDLVAVAHG